MTDAVPLKTLQEESARTNEAIGVIAFLMGILAEIQKSADLNAVKTYAEMGQESVYEWRGGLWAPGPHDDPANWHSANEKRRK